MGTNERNWSRRRLLTVAGLAPAALFMQPACRSDARLSVFAASSLTEALQEAGAAFGLRREGPRLQYNFAASSILATQILEEAPADVFASADEAQMARVIAQERVERPHVIAQNRPTVVAATEARIGAFVDLARPGLRLVIAGPAVPIGRYARDVLELAARWPELGPGFTEAVLANVRSEELSARAVLAKVELGEADAGFVFETDALIADGDVERVSVPEAVMVRAEYPAAVVNGSSHAGASREFLEFLGSPEGQAILTARGFGPAPGSDR